MHDLQLVGSLPASKKLDTGVCRLRHSSSFLRIVHFALEQRPAAKFLNLQAQCLEPSLKPLGEGTPCQQIRSRSACIAQYRKKGLRMHMTRLGTTRSPCFMHPYVCTRYSCSLRCPTHHYPIANWSAPLDVPGFHRGWRPPRLRCPRAFRVS